MTSKTINVLIFIHGIMLADHPMPEEKQYDKLWEPVKNSYNLSQRVDHVVRVNWGQQFDQTSQPRLDERINAAEKFIAQQVDPKRVAQTPGPGNEVIGGFGGDITLRPLWRLLVNNLRQGLFLRGFGDVVYYSAEEGKIAVQLAVYRQVLEALERYRQEVEKDLDSEQPTIKVRLHVIAQSLGVTVANDFLHGLFAQTAYRIHNNPEQAKAPDIVTSDVLEIEKQQTAQRYEFWRLAAKAKRLELGSIVSMASQLPLMMLRSQRVVDTFAKGKTLLPDEIGISLDAKEIIWKIFYDIDDLLGFPTRPLFGDHPAIQDIQVDVGDGYRTHNGYWASEKIHEDVAELLDRRVVK
jgi:hypothetical protein